MQILLAPSLLGETKKNMPSKKVVQLFTQEDFVHARPSQSSGGERGDLGVGSISSSAQKERCLTAAPHGGTDVPCVEHVLETLLMAGISSLMHMVLSLFMLMRTPTLVGAWSLCYDQTWRCLVSGRNVTPFADGSV